MFGASPMHWYFLLAALFALVGIAALIVTVLTIETDEDEEMVAPEPIVSRLRAG
jgi:hypothetical protein